MSEWRRLDPEAMPRGPVWVRWGRRAVVGVCVERKYLPEGRSTHCWDIWVDGRHLEVARHSIEWFMPIEGVEPADPPVPKEVREPVSFVVDRIIDQVEQIGHRVDALEGRFDRRWQDSRK